MRSCTFIGHSDCGENICADISCAVKNLIEKHNVTRFFVGHNGKFDFYVYKVLKKLKEEYDIEIIVVLACLNQKREYIYFSQEETLFPHILEKTPIRFAISKRNMFMIERCEYIICYLNDTCSNTYTFVQKAIAKGLSVINVGKYDIKNI